MKKNCRNSFKLVACVLAVIIFTGCWDSLDVEKREIDTALIVDKKDGYYYFYWERADFSEQNPQSKNQGQKSDFSILVSKGETFTETRDDSNRKNIKEAYLGANRILIFTEAMSVNGIEEYINRVRGQLDYRKSILVATTSNDPMDILQGASDSSASVGFAIESVLDSLVTDGTSFRMNIGDVLQAIAVKNAGFLVPDFTISEGKISLGGYTVFNEYAKRIGAIPADDRKGLVYFLNPDSTFYYDISENGIKYMVKIFLKNKKIKPYYSDNKLSLKIDMNFNATIDFTDKFIPISQDTLYKIKTDLESHIIQDIGSTLYTSKAIFKCDYLNIYKYFRAVYNKEFYKLNWSDVYSQSQIYVTTSVKINQSNLPLKQ